MVQLARDLQVDFYPFFKELFLALVSISDCQDATKIEVGAPLLHNKQASSEIEKIVLQDFTTVLIISTLSDFFYLSVCSLRSHTCLISYGVTC